MSPKSLPTRSTWITLLITSVELRVISWMKSSCRIQQEKLKAYALICIGFFCSVLILYIICTGRFLFVRRIICHNFWRAIKKWHYFIFNTFRWRRTIIPFSSFIFIITYIIMLRGCYFIAGAVVCCDVTTDICTYTHISISQVPWLIYVSFYPPF